MKNLWVFGLLITTLASCQDIPWQDMSNKAKSTAKCQILIKDLINIPKYVAILKTDNHAQELTQKTISNKLSQASSQEIENLFNQVVVYSGVDLNFMYNLTGNVPDLVTLGKDVFTSQNFCKTDNSKIDNVWANLLAHELIHVIQYDQRGVENFLREYFTADEVRKFFLPLESSYDRYMHNPFEEDAYGIAGRHYSLLEKYGEWFRY